MNLLIQSLVRRALTGLAGYLTLHGLLAGSDSDKFVTILVGIVMFLISQLWSWCSHWYAARNGTAAVSLGSPKAMGLLCLLALATLPALFLTGCQTALQSDKIVSVKQRCFGVVVETVSSTAATPNVKLGFCSTVWQMIPTSTNGPIYAPMYADTFDLNSGINPFDTSISENTGAGSVMIGTNGTASAIVPK